MATVKLNWSDQNNGAAEEDGFKIYRSNAPLDLAALPVPIATVAAGVTSYDDTAASIGDNYYIVSAYMLGAERFGGEQNLTIGGVGAVTDPHYSSVILLASFDGAVGDISTIDSGPLGLSLSAVGSAALGAEEPVFGATSSKTNALNESSGYWALSDSSAFDFGLGDFTIEGWARSVFNSSTLDHAILGNRKAQVNNSFSVLIRNTNGGNRLGLQTYGGLTFWGTVNWGTNLHHFAISRNSGTLRLFVDGVLDGKDAGWASQNVGNLTQNVLIGSTQDGVNNRWRGFLDEIRITKGVGRYGADASFPVPALPYPKI